MVCADKSNSPKWILHGNSRHLLHGLRDTGMICTSSQSHESFLWRPHPARGRFQARLLVWASMFSTSTNIVSLMLKAFFSFNNCFRDQIWKRCHYLAAKLYGAVKQTFSELLASSMMSETEMGWKMTACWVCFSPENDFESMLIGFRNLSPPYGRWKMVFGKSPVEEKYLKITTSGLHSYIHYWTETQTTTDIKQWLRGKCPEKAFSAFKSSCLLSLSDPHQNMRRLSAPFPAGLMSEGSSTSRENGISISLKLKTTTFLAT